MEYDQIAKLAQACFQSNPTIVLGSGASMPHGLPSMGDLSKFLQENISPVDANEAKQWKRVQDDLSAGLHLEGALDGKALSAELLKQIVAATWQCVNEKDKKLFLDLAEQPIAFDLGRLFRNLFRSTIKKIDVVTTNYDRVVEYACNSVGLLFQTGFAPGYLQKWETSSGVTYGRGMGAARTVKIWKVHGSLDWFKTGDDEIRGLPAFELPGGQLSPLIVTPGLNKYEKTHEDPFRSTISGADNALKNAHGFLCIGFGFRDQHIHPKIIERCREGNVPIVVLGQDLTSEAKQFLREKAGNNYLGIERAESRSRVFTASHPEGIEVMEGDLWSLSRFNTLIS